jgi:hypothetical protein
VLQCQPPNLFIDLHILNRFFCRQFDSKIYMEKKETKMAEKTLTITSQ